MIYDGSHKSQVLQGAERKDDAQLLSLGSLAI